MVREPLSVFSSPLSDLAIAGSTTERAKGASMSPLIQLKTTPPLLITLTLLCFTLFPKAQAVDPPPPGGYPNFTTAAGDKALQSLTTGAANTAIGNFALFSVSTGNANTAVGALALDLNIADNNTAIGTAALLFNTIGTENTATGTAALETNLTGAFNTANGAFALFSNTAGESNTAIGDRRSCNITGNGNIALGANAGVNLTIGDNNIDIGNSGVAGESSMIRIGDLAVHEGIFLAGITAMTPEAPNQAVLVDPTTGQLGSADVGSFIHRYHQVQKELRAQQAPWGHKEQPALWAQKDHKEIPGPTGARAHQAPLGHKDQPKIFFVGGGGGGGGGGERRNRPQWVNRSNRRYRRNGSWSGYHHVANTAVGDQALINNTGDTTLLPAFVRS